MRAVVDTVVFLILSISKIHRKVGLARLSVLKGSYVRMKGVYVALPLKTGLYGASHWRILSDLSCVLACKEEWIQN